MTAVAGRSAVGSVGRGLPLEAHRELILGLVGETPDATIEELRRSLAGRGLGFGYGTVQRFLVRHGMTRKKKTGHASEQERTDVLARRQRWLDSQPGLDPARLVFIDETWAQTSSFQPRVGSGMASKVNCYWMRIPRPRARGRATVAVISRGHVRASQSSRSAWI